MTSREFCEWMAYARVEPFGESLADVRAGIIASLLVPTKRGRKGKAPSDFFPWLAEERVREKVAAAQNVKALWAQGCAAFGLIGPDGKVPPMIAPKRKPR